MALGAVFFWGFGVQDFRTQGLEGRLRVWGAWLGVLRVYGLSPSNRNLLIFRRF